MSTPDENFEIAVDPSTDDQARTDAIDGLEAANECDTLAEVVRRDGLGDQHREQALTALAHPQCRSMLRRVAGDDDLPDELQERADELLQETPEDAGAGP